MATWISAHWELLFTVVGGPLLVVFISWSAVQLWRYLTRKSPSQRIGETDDSLSYAPPVIAGPKTPNRLMLVAENVPFLRGFALKRNYTHDEILKRIRITIRGNGEGVCLYRNGDLGGEARVWLDIVNFNPFPLTIDRITGQVLVSNFDAGAISDIKKHKVPPLGWTEIYLQTHLNVGQIASIENALKSTRDSVAGIRANFVILSEVREISADRDPTTRNCQFSNFHAKPNT